jgi:hypothetical protein
VKLREVTVDDRVSWRFSLAVVSAGIAVAWWINLVAGVAVAATGVRRHVCRASPLRSSAGPRTQEPRCASSDVEESSGGLAGRASASEVNIEGIGVSIWLKSCPGIGRLDRRP